MKIQTKYVAWIILVIFLFGAGYGLARLYSFSSVAKWKTHMNSATGFSFRYPKDMIVDEVEQAYPGDSSKRIVAITGKKNQLDMQIDINALGRGGNQIANPITGTVMVDGIAISYQAGRIISMGEVLPGTEFLLQAQFSARGDDYIVGFYSRDGEDQTMLARTILSTFRFAQ